MEESELNRIIKDSLIWGSKIPDPSGDFVMSSPRAFDGFGTINGKPFYWESKMSQSLKSFNLQDIKDHQINNLCALKAEMPYAYCWILLGVDAGRADKRVYIFTDPFIIKERREAKNNFFKKELETLPYVVIKKKLIDFALYL